jgi:hypothetical protein
MSLVESCKGVCEWIRDLAHQTAQKTAKMVGEAIDGAEDVVLGPHKNKKERNRRGKS